VRRCRLPDFLQESLGRADVEHVHAAGKRVSDRIETDPFSVSSRQAAALACRSWNGVARSRMQP